MIITKESVLYRNDSNKNPFVSENFRMSEFYPQGSMNYPETVFIHDALPKAAQFLRSHFNEPIEISDTIRYPGDKHYSKSSTHSFGLAEDLNWTTNEETILIRLNHDIMTRGPIFRKLFDLGIRGFGVYDNFFHADARDSRFVSTDTYNGEPISIWDRRETLKYVKPDQTEVVIDELPPIGGPVNIDDVLQAVDLPEITVTGVAGRTDGPEIRAAGIVSGSVTNAIADKSEDGWKGQGFSLGLVIVFSVIALIGIGLILKYRIL